MSGIRGCGIVGREGSATLRPRIPNGQRINTFPKSQIPEIRNAQLISRNHRIIIGKYRNTFSEIGFSYFFFPACKTYQFVFQWGSSSKTIYPASWECLESQITLNKLRAVRNLGSFKHVLVICLLSCGFWRSWRV